MELYKSIDELGSYIKSIEGKLATKYAICLKTWVDIIEDPNYKIGLDRFGEHIRLCMACADMIKPWGDWSVRERLILSVSDIRNLIAKLQDKLKKMEIEVHNKTVTFKSLDQSLQDN